MDTYDPLKKPSPDAWLALDEDKRIQLVEEFHLTHGELLEEEGADRAHAVIHVMVENQLAEGELYVPATLARLMRQGLSRHEAVHAIAAVLAENIYELMEVDDPDVVERFRKLYRRRLDKLTAKRWRKGQV